MASHSPGQRIIRKETSLLQVNPTDDVENILGLSSLCDMLMSSFGHHGHVKVVHNDCHGDVLLTSISERLLESVSISRPTLKLITAAIKEHVKGYGDGALFLGIFALKLITGALKLNIHRRLVLEVHDLLLEECIKYLGSGDDRCSEEISTDDGDVYLRLVRSLYSSKPGCLLFGTELDHISGLTIDSYRMCNASGQLPEMTKLLYVMVAGVSPNKSRLVRGVLYESPQIPVYCQHSVNLPSNKPLTSVVLVETSMAGDSDAFLDASYEVAAGFQLSEAIESQLLSFAADIAAAGVDALICQKVVHPKVKRFLTEHGVVVLDRLGYALFEAVHILAGGSVVDPFSGRCVEQYSSVLGHLEHVVINNKSFIHLDAVEQDEGKPGPVYTVILCHRTEQAIQEVKTIFVKSQQVVGLTERCHRVLYGGGCWQTALLLHLRNIVPSFTSHWASKWNCSKQLLSVIAENFMMSLQQVVVLLNNEKQHSNFVCTLTGHNFTLANDTSPLVCKCGAVSYSKQSQVQFSELRKLTANSWKLGQADLKMASSGNQMTASNDVKVVDAYLPLINALKAAVSISSVFLTIQNYIHNDT